MNNSSFNRGAFAVNSTKKRREREKVGRIIPGLLFCQYLVAKSVLKVESIDRIANRLNEANKIAMR